MGNKKALFPRIKKGVEKFIHDEEGNFPRTRAMVVGPLATISVVIMANESSITAEAVGSHKSHGSHHSHLSHISHHSGHGSDFSYSGDSSLSASDEGSSTEVGLPSHTSHSSGVSSGFSHTAKTLAAENRIAENN